MEGFIGSACQYLDCVSKCNNGGRCLDMHDRAVRMRYVCAVLLSPIFPQISIPLFLLSLIISSFPSFFLFASFYFCLCLPLSVSLFLSFFLSFCLPLSFPLYLSTIRNLKSESFNYLNVWDAKKIKGCVCDSSRDLYDCSGFICPNGDDPLTTGQVHLSPSRLCRFLYFNFISSQSLMASFIAPFLHSFLSSLFSSTLSNNLASFIDRFLLYFHPSHFIYSFLLSYFIKSLASHLLEFAFKLDTTIFY